MESVVDIVYHAIKEAQKHIWEKLPKKVLCVFTGPGKNKKSESDLIRNSLPLNTSNKFIKDSLLYIGEFRNCRAHDELAGIDFYKLCSSIDAMVSWMEELDVKNKIIFVMIQCATKLCKEVAKTQNMRQKLTLSETECQTNHNKFSSVSMELGNTKQKLSKLTEELVSKDKEITSLKDNISSMSRESSVEQEKINSWNAKFSEMIEESTSAQKRIVELTEELLLLREKINTSEKIISVSAENFSIVSMELSTYKEKYFKCEETLSAVQMKFDELSAKFHSTSTDLDVANRQISILEVSSLVKDTKIEQLQETSSESDSDSDDEIPKYSKCRLSDVEYHHRKKMVGRRVIVHSREGILTSVVGYVAYTTSVNGYVYHEDVQLQY